MNQDFGQRFLKILEDSSCAKSKAAELLNVSAAFISQLCSGQRTPSDRTISDICRVFHVDETWLREGVGQMYSPCCREEAISEILSSAISGASTSRDRLIRALARLPDDAFPLIEQYILAAAASIQKDSPPSDD